MKKRLLLIAAAMMLSTVSLAGCSSLKAGEVVLKVNDSELTADVANFYARYTQAQYETYYGAYMGENMWNTEAEKGKTYEESVKSSIQEDLKRMLVLEQHMEEYNVAVSDAEKEVIRKAAKEFDEDNPLENKEKLMSGTETVERVMTLMAVEQKMRDKIIEGTDRNVSDEEANQKSMEYVMFSYQKTGEDGSSSDMTADEKKAVREQADAFAKSAKADQKKFSELAQEQSLEVETASFDAEATVPNAELVKAADALKEKEVTDVVEAEAGCYVARVASLHDKDATESKKQEIITGRENDLFAEVTEEWMDKAKTDVNKKAWKKIDFNRLGVTMKQSEKDPYADDVKTDDQAEDNASSGN